MIKKTKSNPARFTIATFLINAKVRRRSDEATL